MPLPWSTGGWELVADVFPSSIQVFRRRRRRISPIFAVILMHVQGLRGTGPLAGYDVGYSRPGNQPPTKRRKVVRQYVGYMQIDVRSAGHGWNGCDGLRCLCIRLTIRDRRKSSLGVCVKSQLPTTIAICKNRPPNSQQKKRNCQSWANQCDDTYRWVFIFRGRHTRHKTPGMRGHRRRRAS